MTTKLQILQHINGAEMEVEEVIKDASHPPLIQCENNLLEEVFNIVSGTDRLVLEIASIFGNRALVSAAVDVSIYNFLYIILLDYA